MVQKKATVSVFICRWCPNWQLRCWPAPGLAQSIRWFLADFRRSQLPTGYNDATCNIVITADGGFRGTKEIPLKNVIDDALVQCPSVKKVIVLTRSRTPISMIKGRDVWWEDEIKKVETQGNTVCHAEEMDAEDMLFILYTSGSTGKPKGVVHTCGGYMVYTGYTFANVFQYNPGEVLFLYGRYRLDNRAIPISYTDRCRREQPRSCLRAYQPGQVPDAFGRSWKNTK